MSEVTSKTSETSGSSSSHGSNESSSIHITTHKLNGSNFLRWAQSVKFFIRGRGKMGWLDGSKTEPASGDPSYEVWQAENSMVLAWLINSMEPEVSQNFILCDTAKKLWDTVNMMYSNLNNDSQLYDLRRKVHDTKQGNQSVMAYFNVLNQCWLELDLYQDFEWRNEEDFLQYRKIVENERVFDFLGGLNSEFDAVRGRILSMRPIPMVTEAYAEIKEKRVDSQL
ncbi:hypothetical protein OWV82_008883 [Melia azedarach]|uniref:Uncharacterized protein n=1 Tax=Melia azedarach TaxID=155640 RepID=A0ACC1YBN3_MELAZ|nr:hypothetical protein OWV82_008883 [Melia azedarach]